MPWPVEFNGREFEPIPESWITHPDAVDRDRRRGARLLAVSAAPRGSRTLRIRYAHPTEPYVLVCETPGERHNGGVVPAGLVLTGRTWPRSLRATEPTDGRRRCEREHMAEIWSDRVPRTPDAWGGSREVTA
jgi:hypothetical protein